ncbi:membrane protease YdiL (CAAX protease family) [Kineosphaera limosa]|uniref:CAAX prenyl protease 2/Lysostaphin resistance protein A-like domain-containing protein n=1 Tax=Kineosphaera limosa NBRC 100340 TaxID=1184609 RepID=K6W970_9MICO|nr:CPBP family intramembrane glutamic endopeptidase [Kineosphaera limosa]NYE00081.1 membrane protease YdiL (CAAX protease family) [Kineosphaera limosa]GAB95745.1 hypothetical protein KILIM_026_00160 [Kineosphaera limosa NBRC 100340]
MTAIVRNNPVLTFIVLAFAGSWLVWAPWFLGYSGIGLFTWQMSSLTALNVHVLGLFVGPFLSALIVSRMVDGPGAPLRLLRRIVQWRVNPLHYIVALVAVPLAIFAGYLSVPRGPGTPSVTWTLAAFVLLFVALAILGPVQEEVGWRGFALPRLQQSLHPLVAAVGLGLLVFVYQVPLMTTSAWNLRFATFTEMGLYAAFLVAVSIVLCALRNLAHASLLPSILAAHMVNWSLIAAPVAMGVPLETIAPATMGMSVLALVAVLLTGGRLGAPGSPSATDPARSGIAVEPVQRPQSQSVESAAR